MSTAGTAGATRRRRSQWSTGPDDGTPANEITPGAVVEYRPGHLMVVTRSDAASVQFVGKRWMLHGWILTAPDGRDAPKVSHGPRQGQPLYRVGGGAEVMTTPRHRIRVHDQRPHTPGPCPCYGHSPEHDQYAPPRPWKEHVPVTTTTKTGKAARVPQQTAIRGQHADGTDCTHNLGSPTKARESGCPGRKYYYAACKGGAVDVPWATTGCEVHYRTGYQDGVKHWKSGHRDIHAHGEPVPAPQHMVTVLCSGPQPGGESRPGAERQFLAWCSCGQYSQRVAGTDPELLSSVKAEARQHLAGVIGTYVPYRDRVKWVPELPEGDPWAEATDQQ